MALPPNFNQELFQAALAYQGLNPEPLPEEVPVVEPTTAGPYAQAVDGLIAANQPEPPPPVETGYLRQEPPLSMYQQPVDSQARFQTDVVEPLIDTTLQPLEPAPEVVDPYGGLFASPAAAGLTLENDGLRTLGRGTGLSEAVQGSQAAATHELNSGLAEDAVVREALTQSAREAQEGADLRSKLAQEMDSKISEIQERANGYRQYLDNTHVSPAGVWSDMSGFERLANSLAISFGVMSQFALGKNIGMEMVQKRVDDEMNARQNRLNQTERSLNNIPREIQMARSIFDDKEAADNAERALRLKSIMQELDAALLSPEIRGTQREAAYQEARAKLGAQIYGLLTDAEKLEYNRWLKEQEMAARLMKLAGKGTGAGAAPNTLTANPKQVSPPTGAFYRVTPGGGREQVFFNISDWSDADKVKWSEASAGVQSGADAVATINRLELDWKALPDDEKARATQQMYRLVNDVVRGERGAQTEGDVERMTYEVMGGKAGDPTSLRNFMRNPESLKQTINSFIGAKRSRIGYVMNTYRTPEDHRQGASYVWGDYTDTPDALAVAAEKESRKSPKQKAADAHKKLRTDLAAGVVPDPRFGVLEDTGEALDEEQISRRSGEKFATYGDSQLVQLQGDAEKGLKQVQSQLMLPGLTPIQRNALEDKVGYYHQTIGELASEILYREERDEKSRKGRERHDIKRNIRALDSKLRNR